MTDPDPDRCARCGRPLRHPLAKAAGFGAICALHELGPSQPRGRHRHPDGQLALDTTLEESA